MASHHIHTEWAVQYQAIPNPVRQLLIDMGPPALRLFGHSLARQSLLLVGKNYSHQAAISLVRLDETMASSPCLARTVITATNNLCVGAYQVSYQPDAELSSIDHQYLNFICYGAVAKLCYPAGSASTQAGCLSAPMYQDVCVSQ